MGDVSDRYLFPVMRRKGNEVDNQTDPTGYTCTLPVSPLACEILKDAELYRIGEKNQEFTNINMLKFELSSLCQNTERSYVLSILFHSTPLLFKPPVMNFVSRFYFKLFLHKYIYVCMYVSI